MSLDNNQKNLEKKFVTKKEKRYIIISSAIAFSCTFIVLAFRLLSYWELVLRKPMTEAWTFFFWGLIGAFIISVFVCEKKEIVVVFLSSFIALFWELLVEPFGWYFNLWPVAPHLDDPVEVFYLSLQLGFEFYAAYYALGILYIYIYKSKNTYKNQVLIGLCLGLTVVGWLGDIFIARFDTYIITFFVWLTLNILHLIGVIKLYNYFYRIQI